MSDKKHTVGGAFRSIFRLVIRTVDLVEKAYDTTEDALDSVHDVVKVANKQSKAYLAQTEEELRKEALIQSAENKLAILEAERRVAELEARFAAETSESN